ncbi:MAG: flagellar basal body P-ring protein FlgI, partial [Planctomycetota bacterium]
MVSQGRRRVCTIALSVLLLAPATAWAQRIKDIARVEGDRLQQMKGIGLVIGLPGTGDGPRSGLKQGLYSALLDHLKIEIPPSALRSKNVAVAMVTASVPSSTKVGSRIDVTVSSIEDARSLKGGWLLETALVGPGDGGRDSIYAIAQGPVDATDEVPTLGRGVAILEEDISIPFRHQGDTFRIILHRPDFSSATRVARAINNFPFLRFRVPESLPVAHALDSGSVEVRIPS